MVSIQRFFIFRQPVSVYISCDHVVMGKTKKFKHSPRYYRSLKKQQAVKTPTAASITSADVICDNIEVDLPAGEENEGHPRHEITTCWSTLYAKKGTSWWAQSNANFDSEHFDCCTQRTGCTYRLKVMTCRLAGGKVVVVKSCNCHCHCVQTWHHESH